MDKSAFDLELPMSSLERAISIAAEVHVGQVDKAGHLYILILCGS